MLPALLNSFAGYSLHWIRNLFYLGGKETGPASSLQKSRKSISMDDLRRNFARSTVEASFDDDVDFPVAPFNKQRDFNQSFRAAVIDKSYNEPYANVVSRTGQSSYTFHDFVLRCHYFTIIMVSLAISHCN